MIRGSIERLLDVIDNVAAGMHVIFGRCTCAESHEPRICKRHPWAYTQNLHLLSQEAIDSSVADLEERIKNLEEANDMSQG